MRAISHETQGEGSLTYKKIVIHVTKIRDGIYASFMGVMSLESVQVKET